MSAVTLSKVVKRYGGHLALNGFSMSVPQGSICALIGPNGCGKTTTMGVIAGLLRYESGSVDLLGLGPFNAKLHAGRIGLMPQDASPSLQLPLEETLRYFAELQGNSATAARRMAAECLAKVKLQERARAYYQQLSHGMRRRFVIAQALLGTPELILLDEPTAGLDPELVVQIRELIVSLRGEVTLIVSSHILTELETMCDHAIFVDKGQVLREGRMAEFTSASAVVRFTLSRIPDLGKLEIELQGCIVQWQAPCLTVRPPKSQSVEETNARCLPLLLAENVGILAIDTGDSLENAYMRLKQQRPSTSV